MANNAWTSPKGLEDLKKIISSQVPWPAGPHDWQVTATARTLDGLNQLVVTACGDGKTAAAYLPLLVLEALAANRSLPRYGSRVPDQPVVLIVTPLSDLGHSQVDEMKRLGITAVALDVETIDTASLEGQDLLREVGECKWAVVIISPERLTSPAFDDILRSADFRANLALYVVDEAHIVIPWSLTFRKSYGQLGKVQARIRSDVPTLALTATSNVDLEVQMMRLLGVTGYQTIRRSCERPNLQTVFRTLSHGLGGHEFPDIAWVTRARRKTIIYCSTIDLGHRVASYLWRLFPPGQARFKTVQEYNGLTWADSNAAAAQVFSTEAEALIMIATVKFGMGVDVRNVEISINLGLPESAEAILQQNGRAGRDPNVDAYGITYIEASIVASITAADHELTLARNTARGTKSSNREGGLCGANKSKGSSKKAVTGAEGDGKAKRTNDKYLREVIRGYVSGECLVAAFNKMFGSPGTHSHEACFDAQRRLPCSNCLSRPQLSGMLKGLHVDTTLSSAEAGAPSSVPEDSPVQEEFLVSHLKLTRDMRERAISRINDFQRQHRPVRKMAKLLYLPSVAFIPSSLLTLLIDRFHLLRDRETLAELMFDWEHLETDGHALFNLIRSTNGQFDEEHARKKKESAAKGVQTRAANAARRLEKMVLSTLDGEDAAPSHTATELSGPATRRPQPANFKPHANGLTMKIVRDDIVPEGKENSSTSRNRAMHLDNDSALLQPSTTKRARAGHALTAQEEAPQKRVKLQARN